MGAWHQPQEDIVAARKLYDGYGLTELRAYASEYKIPGRTRMTGEELVVAVRQVWVDNRKAKEATFLTGGVVVAGVTKLAMDCGCVIRATSSIMADTRFDDRPLFVRAEMVSFCAPCKISHPAGVDYYNERASDYRWMLYQLRHLPTEDQAPAPAAELCNAPNPYPINGRCNKLAGHDAPDNDVETKLHTNGFSRWSCEDLARQVDDELTDHEITRPTTLAPAVLRAAVAAVAPMVFNPHELHLVEIQRQAQMAAARSYGLLGGAA